MVAVIAPARAPLERKMREQFSEWTCGRMEAVDVPQTEQTPRESGISQKALAAVSMLSEPGTKSLPSEKKNNATRVKAPKMKMVFSGREGPE